MVLCLMRLIIVRFHTRITTQFHGPGSDLFFKVNRFHTLLDDKLDGIIILLPYVPCKMYVKASFPSTRSQRQKNVTVIAGAEYNLSLHRAKMLLISQQVYSTDRSNAVCACDFRIEKWIRRVIFNKHSIYKTRLIHNIPVHNDYLFIFKIKYQMIQCRTKTYVQCTRILHFDGAIRFWNFQQFVEFILLY